MMPSCAIVIPVYNHGTTLRSVVKRALIQHSLVIVVDDGSTDGGPDSLTHLPIHLLRLPRNCGKGAALLAGANKAASLGASHMICLDADGQHYPEDIPLLLAAIKADPGAIIIGKRNFDTPNVPCSSRFGRSFSAFWMQVQTGLSISDMQSGFRAYPLSVLDHLQINEQGYAFEIEVLVRAAWGGVQIREIDIRVYYPIPPKRISHFNAIRDNLRITLLNTRLTIRALVPLPFHQYSLDREGQISLLRPFQSLQRLLAAKNTPADLGRSAALGMGISCLPLPGLQSILLLCCIGPLKLNRLCALAMIPLSWPPFVPALAVFLGYRLRQGHWLTEFSFQTLALEAHQRLVDWFIGSLALAPFLGLVAGICVWTLALLITRSLTTRCTREQ